MTDGGRSTASAGDDRLAAIAKGSGFLAAGDLFSYVVRFVAALVLARALGANEYGLYTLTVSLAFMVSGVANLGLDAAMERYVAVLRNRRDFAEVEGAMQIGVVGSSLGALIVSALVFVGADPIAQALFDDDRLVPSFRLMAALVPFVVSTTLLAAVVRGFKRMDYAAFATNFVQPVVRIVLIGMLAVVGIDARAALVVLIVSYIASTTVLLDLIRRSFGADRPAHASRNHTREIAVFSFPFWFSGIVGQLRRNVQPVLLGALSSVKNVGIFTLVASANLIARVALIATRTAMRPILAETLDEEDHGETTRLYRATTRWVLTATFPSALVLLLYSGAILQFFGEAFTEGAAALWILTLAELANAATGTCGSILDMSGRHTAKIVNKGVEFGLTIGLNLVLIARFGLVGAAVAFLLTTVSIQLLRLIQVRVLLKLSPYDVRILKPVAAAAVAYGFGRLLDGVVPATNGIPELLLNSVLVVAVYVAALGAQGLTDEDRRIVGAAVRRVRRRR